VPQPNLISAILVKHDVGSVFVVCRKRIKCPFAIARSESSCGTSIHVACIDTDFVRNLFGNDVQQTQIREDEDGIWKLGYTCCLVSVGMG